MRTKFMVVLGVLALVFVTALPLHAQAADGDSRSADDTGCFYVLPTSVEVPGKAGNPPSFSARETSDILLNAVFPRPLKGEHLLTLKVYTPHGFLYRQIDVPVAWDTGRAPQGRKVETYPYPVKEQFPESKKINQDEVMAVAIHLPVAGSSIMTSSLYGSWKVEMELDGNPAPCRIKETRFIISE